MSTRTIITAATLLALALAGCKEIGILTLEAQSAPVDLTVTWSPVTVSGVVGYKLSLIPAASTGGLAVSSQVIGTGSCNGTVTTGCLGTVSLPAFGTYTVALSTTYMLLEGTDDPAPVVQESVQVLRVVKLNQAGGPPTAMAVKKK